MGLPGITGDSVQDIWHGALGPSSTPLPPGTAGCSGCSFSFPGRSHFPSHRSGPARPVPSREPRPSQGPDRSPLYPLGTRRQIPVGPRSAKSAHRDGKLQQYWPLGPPPAPSRNSRPWTLAPQLIHSRGAGPPPHAGTDVRTRAPVRPRTGRAPEQVARLVSMGLTRPALTVRLLHRLPRRASPELWCPAASALPCFGFASPLSGAARSVPDKCHLLDGQL